MRIQDGAIVALSTPLASSALAIIRASGNGCINMLVPCFSRPDALRHASGHSLVRGVLWDNVGHPIDDVLVAVFRAPKSYTGEESFEIHCHGSIPGLERIFSLLFACGFRQALGGEFTLRAFLNGKMDLTRAEAVQEIVSARSQEAQVLALARLGGAVFRKIDGIKQKLVQLMALISINLDYAEDEVGDAPLDMSVLDLVCGELQSLLAGYEQGRKYQHGLRLAIAGKTNAGKSSLFNVLLREDRSIVSDQHGTTRDYIEASLVIAGVPVRVYDTAGFRELEAVISENVIEAEGMKRSTQVVDTAALVLYVVDGAAGLDVDDLGHISSMQAAGRDVILVWNKSDLSAAPSIGHAVSCPVVAVSALRADGIDTLMAALKTCLHGKDSIGDGDVLIDSERQRNLLLRALESLQGMQLELTAGYPLDAVVLGLQDAMQALGEITGEVYTDDILDVMFSGFCVGK